MRGGKGVTVSDIASRCGFPHLGRFSSQYRQRYGERPSQTLARSSIHFQEQDTPLLFVASRDYPPVAVLPIEARGIDPMIARDITDALVTALVRSGLAVTDRPDRARYHIRGVCRAHEGTPRAMLQLLDAENGRHILAFQQDAEDGEGGYFQERLAMALSAVLQPGLRSAEAERVRLKSNSDLTVQEMTMKAWPHATALSADGSRRAVDLLECALDRDPEHALAIALGGMVPCPTCRLSVHRQHLPGTCAFRGTGLARSQDRRRQYNARCPGQRTVLRARTRDGRKRDAPCPTVEWRFSVGMGQKCLAGNLPWPSRTSDRAVHHFA